MRRASGPRRTDPYARSRLVRTSREPDALRHGVAQHFLVTAVALPRSAIRAMPAVPCRGTEAAHRVAWLAAFHIDAAQRDTSRRRVAQHGEASVRSEARICREGSRLPDRTLKAGRETERIPVFAEERADGVEVLRVSAETICTLPGTWLDITMRLRGRQSCMNAFPGHAPNRHIFLAPNNAAW